MIYAICEHGPIDAARGRTKEIRFEPNAHSCVYDRATGHQPTIRIEIGLMCVLRMFCTNEYAETRFGVLANGHQIHSSCSVQVISDANEISGWREQDALGHI